MYFPHPGFPGFFNVIASVVAGIFTILCFVVVVGLLFLLVRFLLVGTRAAQIYVAEHSPVPPAPSAAPGPVGAPAGSAASTTTTPATAPTKPVAAPAKPATKPRTPKTPPTT